jgi:maltose alpha-D-glucosyltransferase / alpha-amylase
MREHPDLLPLNGMDTTTPPVTRVLSSRPSAGAAGPDATLRDGDPLWFKDAVIYELHVKAFHDASGDGIGDFRGLTEKLDYLQDLGVDTLWLLPFYPSPFRDDGYDVADYHNVHPAYGTRADFRNFVREAHRRGLRIITELVLNHTSDQHPWFQAARRAPAGSNKRDFYVWSSDPQKYAGTRIIFTDTEKSNWAWDDEARAYYWHRFFSHQPDLNFDNPRVRQAVFRIMRFWLDMGVDGFRLDAVPYLIEREGTSNENLPETYAVIKELRAKLDARYRNRVLLAEANQWPEDVREYFGDGDACHMAYHFPLMPRMYMAIAQEDRHPVVDILRQTPDIPDNAQWAIFLRNHDELTLEMVTHRERDYMYRMYAADPRARLNLGIRRRLAPLLENDRERIKLMNSLLLSMPGSPIIYYGDEIGMGDNIFLGDRDGVRTPMQWSPDRNAGFSRADPQRLYLPPIMDAMYGYERVNVESQARDKSSLLAWMQRVIAVRRSTRVFGRGRLRFLHPGNRKILAYLRELGDEVILCVANLGRTSQPVELDLREFRGRVPVEMLGRTSFPPIDVAPYLLTLPAHGFYWFRLSAEAPPPDWYEERAAREDLPSLVLFDGWNSLFRDRVVPWRIGLAERTRAQLEGEVLPGYLSRQRWSAAPDSRPGALRITDDARFSGPAGDWLLTLIDDDRKARYFMPLALAWEDRDEERVKLLGPATLAKVRQQASVGVLADALSDPAFCVALVDAIGANKTIKATSGELRFSPTSAFGAIVGNAAEPLTVSRPLAKATNTVVTLGDRLFLKAYRRLLAGVHPEVEIGRYLTDVANFAHAVPVAGTLDYVDATGQATSLALLQAFVAHQGDGWTVSVDSLARELDAAGAAEAGAPAHGGYLALMTTLGTRTAELHAALARPTDDDAFAPEPVTQHDLQRWARALRAEADATLALLSRASGLDTQAQALAQAIVRGRAALDGLADAVERLAPAGSKTRLHGDFHLGQVLLAANDFVIMDFEGPPERSAEQRRAKDSPLRDVATMLRSIDAVRPAALALAGPSAELRARLEPGAHRWCEAARASFLDAYRARALASGVLETDSVATMATTLALFEAEAALSNLRLCLQAGRAPSADLQWLAARAGDAGANG